jgi:hypothetical protein
MTRTTTITGLIAATLLALPLALAAADQPNMTGIPPRTIKFRPATRQTLSREPYDAPAPRHGYFTNQFLPANAPESHNHGAFICSQSEGTATYMEQGQCFHRNLTFKGIRRTEEGIPYYFFEEAKIGAQKRTWSFEAKPNAQGNCAIYYQVNDGPFTLFQVANKAEIASSR